MNDHTVGFHPQTQKSKPVRTVDDIVDYTKRNHLPGILIAIDFEKAFDTLNFNFLVRTLHKSNFGLSFIQWIRVLYKNASSAVMNDGYTTGPFSLGRGVRQGDLLSPYLFIIALEILALRIRSDNQIQGLKIGQETVKLSSFADDMTCFLENKLSYIALFEILKSFEELSGLKVNHEKTELLALGNNTLHDVDFPKHTLCEVIKILRVHFGYDVRQRDSLNFKQTLKAVKKSLNMRKWRGLSLLGRIQIIKTFAVPRLMYNVQSICVTHFQGTN